MKDEKDEGQTRGEKRQIKRERSPAAVFAISFTISLAVLLVVVMAILSATVAPKQQERRANEGSSEEVADAFQYSPSGKDALSLLWISCNQRSEAPFAFTLCRFDPENNRILLVPIPAQTIVTVGAKTGTFLKHYDYAGCSNARLAAESLFLLNDLRYVRVAKNGAVNLVDALGGLEHKFETGYETDSVSVPSGNHLLSGELLYEIAQSPPEGSSADTWRIGLYEELCEKRFGPELADRTDYLMEVFWNNTDTDLSQYDYSTRFKALRHYLNEETSGVEVRPLSGSWNEKRTEFTPDETSINELRLLLGAKTEEEE